MGTNLLEINLGNGIVVEQVVVGELHTCVLIQGGRVKCFGNAEYGQLGYESSFILGDFQGEMGNALPFVDLGTSLVNPPGPVETLSDEQIAAIAGASSLALVVLGVALLVNNRLRKNRQRQEKSLEQTSEEGGPPAAGTVTNFFDSVKDAAPVGILILSFTGVFISLVSLLVQILLQNT